jgi:ethanolamine utilization protein EutN
MLLAKVIGNVVSSAKAPAHKGYKFLLVRPEDVEGKPSATTFLAVDLVAAGVGDRVLLLREGSSVRDLVANPKAPIHAAVVGIVDEVTR